MTGLDFASLSALEGGYMYGAHGGMEMGEVMLRGAYNTDDAADRRMDLCLEFAVCGVLIVAWTVVVVVMWS
jgi:hypothetical protein